MPIVGIYKLTSPSGKVYIGQSVDIRDRINHYGHINGAKSQIKLYNSLKKYGFVNHITEVIHILPNDVDREVLNQYEVLYMQLYADCGIELLNIKGGGSNGRHSEETKKKTSEKLIGRKYSQETIDKMRKATLSRTAPHPMLGKKHSEETKLKMRTVNKRKPIFTDEGRAKLIEVGRKLGLSRKGKPLIRNWSCHTEETKRKISEKKKGCKGVRNRAIVCVSTGVTYDSIRDAAKVVGMKESTLAMQLRGCNPNKTTLKYA